jgi:hypothetical protein
MKFASFGALADHFDKIILRLPAAELVMLEEIGVSVAERARKKLGTYQPGWPPLSDYTLDEKAREGWPSPSPLLRTGAMEASIKHQVLPPKMVKVGSTDRKALFHELGTSKMPARAFIGPAMAENMPQNMIIIGRGVARVFRGR